MIIYFLPGRNFYLCQIFQLFLSFYGVAQNFEFDSEGNICIFEPGVGLPEELHIRCEPKKRVPKRQF